MVISVFGACTMEEETVIIPKTLEQYKQEFQEFVTSQIDFVDNCVNGYNKGDFRSTINYGPYTTNYKTKLVAALAVLDKADLKIEDIAKAYTTFAAEGKLYQAEIFISDRRPLHELIVACDALNTATPDGSSSGSVNPADRVPFAAAIAAAKVKRTATALVERQVQEEVDKLNAAKQAFESAIIP
ncbi:MAG: hypothetical protein Q7J05_00855 [Paludibacter sp.]|nr:hypothetical protein [Paludibacter sp.]